MCDTLRKHPVVRCKRFTSLLIVLLVFKLLGLFKNQRIDRRRARCGASDRASLGWSSLPIRSENPRNRTAVAGALGSWLCCSGNSSVKRNRMKKTALVIGLTRLVQCSCNRSGPSRNSAVGYQYQYQCLSNGPGGELPQQYFEHHHLYGYALTSVREGPSEGGQQERCHYDPG